MKIFAVTGEEGHELTHVVDSEDFEALDKLIDGTPRAKNWTPVPMELITEEEDGTKLQDSDAPWLRSNTLVFKPRAQSVLEPLLAAQGEFLPLECPQTKLSVFNPTFVVDALDESASIVKRLQPSGRIFRIEKHVFRPEVIRTLRAFKIKSLRVSPTFVTEEVVDRWRSAGLKGLTFNLLWKG